MRNWNRESTICGVYWTNASRTPAISFNAPSAIAGTHSISTSTRVRTTSFTAFPISPALLAITLQNSTMASPIFATIAGIRSAMPVMITVRDATTAVAPAVPAAASAVKPTAIADKPVPAAKSPAPSPKTATPIRAIAPLKPRIVGTNGVRTAPATPITVKAPARDTRPLTIAVQLIAPRMLRTGVRMANADAATNIAADPDKVPVIALKPTAIIPREPPRATSPFAISFHSIPPIFSRAEAIIRRAVETAIRPVPIAIIFLGMKLTAIVTVAKAPAIPTRPTASSLQFIAEKSFTAAARIFIAAPMPIKAALVAITCCAFPVRRVNATISARTIPIEVSPRPISPQFICAKSSQADARILIASDNITIPVAVVTDWPLNFAVFINNDTSASSTPTPTSPLASPSQSSADKSSHAEARTLIAAANITIWDAPFIIVGPPLPSDFAATIIVAVKPATPVSPVASCLASKSPSFFKALARINTEVEIANIAVVLLITPLACPLILLNTAIEAIKSANRTVMAPRAALNFALSIRESATNDATRIAMADAIFSKVPACN